MNMQTVYDNNVPNGALENKPIDITICGDVYQFADPVRRRARWLIGSALKIISDYDLMDANGLVDETSMKTAAGTLMAMPDVLDWVYDALAIKRNARNKIEAEFDDAEVIDAYVKIMEHLQRPFVGTPNDADPVAEVEVSSMIG